jgi:chemotaxis methyl-accepting protein methylase
MVASTAGIQCLLNFERYTYQTNFFRNSEEYNMIYQALSPDWTARNEGWEVFLPITTIGCRDKGRLDL